jgi:hypothetical protein
MLDRSFLAGDLAADGNSLEAERPAMSRPGRCAREKKLSFRGLNA